MKISLVSAAWADVEFFLTLIAGQATATIHSVGVDGRGGARGQAGAASWAAMKALESLSARISVVRAILAVSVTPELIAEFEAMIPAIRKAAGARNDVVHCRWHFSDAYPDDVLSPTGKTPRYLRYTGADLDKIASRISKEADRVNHFSARCFGHRVDEERRRLAPKLPM